MKEAATINFTEVDNSDDACAVVRYDEASVAICISLKSNGDMEVVMRKEDAKQLMDALKKAIG